MDLVPCSASSFTLSCVRFLTNYAYRNTLVSSGLENPLQLWLAVFNGLTPGCAYTEEATPDNVFKVSRN